MNKKLETLVRSDGTVDSQVIAERLGVQHKATFQLIKRHKEGFEEFGYLEFKILDKSKSGREKHVLLNEDQTYFLLTLSKNTVTVVNLKQALVRAFSKLRRAEARRASVQWQQNRALGKYVHRQATDSIKAFIAYAKVQGSKHPERYYIHFTKLANRVAGVASRDDATEDQLALLSVAEQIVGQALLDAMEAGVPYKSCYEEAKHRIGRYASILGI